MSGSDVYEAVLAIHENSITFDRATLRTNELFLTVTQVLLMVGISLIVAGLFVSV